MAPFVGEMLVGRGNLPAACAIFIACSVIGFLASLLIQDETCGRRLSEIPTDEASSEARKFRKEPMVTRSFSFFELGEPIDDGL